MRFPDSLFPDWEFAAPPPKWPGLHAGIPGTGPKGETCKTCVHYTRIQYAKVYRKCGLCESQWTHGAGTDIRAGDPSCEFWEARKCS